MVSMVARAARQASGFPPKVAAWVPGFSLAATSGRATSPPRATPPATALAQDIHQKIRRPDDDLGLIPEIGGRIHEAHQLDHPDQPRQIAVARFLDLGQKVHGADPGDSCALFDRDGVTQFAGCQLAVHERH